MKRIALSVAVLVGLPLVPGRALAMTRVDRSGAAPTPETKTDPVPVQKPEQPPGAETDVEAPPGAETDVEAPPAQPPDAAPSEAGLANVTPSETAPAEPPPGDPESTTPPAGDPVSATESPAAAAPSEATPVEVAPSEAAAPTPTEETPPFATLASAPHRPSGRPPPPGTGMRVGGGILIGLGTLGMIGGALIMNAGSSEGVVPLVIGAVEVGAGIGLVVPGVIRSNRLRDWQSEHSISVPKTGNGMIVGGSVLLGSTALDSINAALVGTTPFGVVLIVAEGVTGSVLLGVGLVRKKRYREWESRRFRGSASLLPGGATVGLRGRF